jgi:hypothetical protein
LAISLRATAAAVNVHLPVAGPRFGRRSAASWQIKNLEHANSAMKRKGNRAPYADVFGGFLHALAVDARMPLLDYRLGLGSGLHQSDEE